MTTSIAATGGSASAAPAAPATSTAPAQTSTGSEAPKAPVDTTSKAPDAKAAPPKETAAEKAQRLKFKAKVEGREEEVEWDETEAARTYQKAKHYEKTRGQFEAERRQFQEQLDALSKDPLGFLKSRKIDLVELGKQQAAREAELAAMDPTARELAEAKAELDRLRGESKQRAEQEKVTAAQAEHQKLVGGLKGQLQQALKLMGVKTAGDMPPGQKLSSAEQAAVGAKMKLLAEVMELAEHNGEPPLSVEQLAAAGERLEAKRLGSDFRRNISDAGWRQRNAPLVKELTTALIGQLQGPELVELLGKDAVGRITRESLTALRKSPIPVIAEARQGEQTPVPQKKLDTPQSMFSVLDQLAG